MAQGTDRQLWAPPECTDSCMAVSRPVPHGAIVSVAGVASNAVCAFLLGGLTIVAPALSQSQASPPQIYSASAILVEPAVETPLAIQVGPAESLPRNTFLRIRGLPRNVSLSEGHSITTGSWAIPLTGLSRLKLSTPIGSEGRSEITISLMAIDGTVLSEIKSTLVIAAASSIADKQAQQAVPAPANTAALGPAAPGAPPSLSAPQVERAPPRPVPAGPQLKPEERDRARLHMQKGDESLLAGNITVARLFYQKAAEIGLSQGALSLAGTYDANELSRWKIFGGIQADREQARKWYEKARELGAPEAAERLQRLGFR